MIARRAAAREQCLPRVPDCLLTGWQWRSSDSCRHGWSQLVSGSLAIAVLLALAWAPVALANRLQEQDLSTRLQAAAATTARPASVELRLPAGPVAASGEALHASAYGIERAQFREAVKAINAGDTERFQPLRKALSHYPLVRYLDYLELRQQIAESPDKPAIAALNRYEKQYDDLYLTQLLTRRLQGQLVEKEDWTLLLAVSKSRVARSMPCATLRALDETGHQLRWTDELSDYWVARGSFPDLCSAQMEKLEQAGVPSFAALWQRIYKAIKDGRKAHAKALAGLLATQDKVRVLAWIDALNAPSQLILSEALSRDDLLNRNSLLDLLRRWSRQDPPAAVAYWQKVRGNYNFTADQRYELDRELGLRGAWLRRSEAYDWLYLFDARDEDLEVLEWRVRSALYAQDWPAVMRSLLELPAAELAEDHWSYWHARALVETGRSSEAEQVYQRIAKLATYYGFLAADRLGLDYNIIDQSDFGAEITALLADLRLDPRLIRAREYLHAGVAWQGRREWGRVLAQASTEQQAATALLALEWQLPDRAIASANAAGRKKALALRFPYAYAATIIQAAERYDLSEDFIIGVARRESAFIPDIKSPAGAVGLMQLMPATAKDVLAQLRRSGRWDLKGRNVSLTEVESNVDMGSFYLDQIGNRFEKHLALTAASYNAGPHRTRAWLPEQGSVEADIWIDTIPFSETRRYVRAVLAYMTIYQWRRTQPLTVLDQGVTTSAVPVTRLTEHLLPVRHDAEAGNKSAEAVEPAN